MAFIGYLQHLFIGYSWHFLLDIHTASRQGGGKEITPPELKMHRSALTLDLLLEALHIVCSVNEELPVLQCVNGDKCHSSSSNLDD